MKLVFAGPIKRLLMQGVTPEKIALSMAVGVALGIFPVIGATTALCAVAAVLFRLNLPAIQIVNYAVYPLQICLLIPFLRAGEWLFRAGPLVFSLTQMITLVRRNAFRAAVVLWTSIWHAIAVWCLIAPIVVAILYIVLKPLLAHLRYVRFKPETQSAG